MDQTACVRLVMIDFCLLFPGPKYLNVHLTCMLVLHLLAYCACHSMFTFPLQAMPKVCIEQVCEEIYRDHHNDIPRRYELTPNALKFINHMTDIEAHERNEMVRNGQYHVGKSAAKLPDNVVKVALGEILVYSQSTAFLGW